MDTVLDIGRLTRAEKLRAMEELWEDLTRSQDEYTMTGRGQTSLKSFV